MTTVGNILEASAERDAIHVAVAPVVAGEALGPADHVGFMVSGAVGKTATTIGIVDPFLKSAVRPGDRFWLFLYPNTVTSLRHEWEHPAFDPVAATTSEAKDSKQWIAAFASRLDYTYNRLMTAAREWLDWEEYTSDRSEIYKSVTPEEWEEFWRHYEAVTRRPTGGMREHFFTCSC